MKRTKNKSFVLPMAAVIIPGLIICTLALMLVSRQKSARLLDVRRDFTILLNRTVSAVDVRTQSLVEKVFTITRPEPAQLKDSETILAYTRNLLLQNPIIKFPFFISSAKGFLFPVMQPVQFPGGGSPALDAAGLINKEKPAVKRNYLKAYDLEYQQQKFPGAVKHYNRCLQQGASAALAPWLYSAVARCYFKLRRYRQAIAYYNKVLNNSPRLQQQDPLLYFTVLRQKAVSLKQLTADTQAAGVYLRLYEEILAQRGKAGSGPFLFYKNEALDFLNSRDNAVEEAANRFKKAKALDRLDKATELDISIRWLYFGYAGLPPVEKRENDSGNDTIRFLKLRELYEADNEKTRFYNWVKSLQYPVGNNETPGITNKKPFKDPLTSMTHRIFMRRLPNMAGEIVYFGFMLSMDHVSRTVLPAAAQQQLNSRDVTVAVKGLPETAPGKSLLSMAMGSLFPGRELSLYAETPDFFRQRVQKDIRLYYILLAALVLTLAAGIFVFYKYITREAQLVRLKSAFVDSASHTLKTPLTRMSLLAENVTQGWVKDEKQKEEFFKAIVDETARMSEMIENMLNFSRIESGKQYYKPEPLHLGEMVVEVVEHYRVYAQNLGFQLNNELVDDLPMVNLDREAARLIIGNLLHNALKYWADEKYISLGLYREAEEIILEIRDRGIGIAEKDMNLLFKKFSRVPDDRVNAAEGSGLGLFLVKHAVEAHNGRVRVSSEVGKGTVFIIALPVSKRKKNGKNIDY